MTAAVRSRRARASERVGGWRGSAVVACALVAALPACRDEDHALAELVQVTGAARVVERATGRDDWKPAPLGSKFYLGDAARTADNRALLRLGDASRLEMDPHTVLRFGDRGAPGREQPLLVELGSVEVVGDGAYQLALGEISVESNGGVRISAGEQGNRVELLVGRASIRTSAGEVKPLERGAVLALDDLEIRGLGVDARRPEPVVDAAPAPSLATAPPATLKVVGKGAEVRAPGETRWRPLDPAALPGAGASVRARGGGKVSVDNGAVTLELGGGAVVAIGPELSLALTSGSAAARTAPGAGAELALPGGKVALSAHRAGSRSELEVGRRETRVRATGGRLTVTGSAASAELGRGEIASLTSDGALRVLDAIPRRVELALSAGDSATVHDARGSAAIQLRFSERCPGDGVIELDSSASFRAPRQSSGEGAANLQVNAGSYHYRVRCESVAGDGKPVASGRLTVVRDAGRRPLPPAPPPFSLAADGRTYRLGYQGAIPPLVVEWRGAKGAGYVLHLASAGKDLTFPASGATATIPGARLRDGSFSLWFEGGGQRSKVSTLIIDFDNTAPAVYIDEPDEDAAWAGSAVKVRGAVSADWTVSVDGVELPLDRQRRFSASVPAPSEGVLAIKLSHPQRGVHYYLRRKRQ